MKRLTFIVPILCLAACATHPPKKIVIVPAVDSSHFVRPGTDLRLPERLREYRFGRYVDPSDGTIMHEEHPVYRVERSARWNLSPLGSREAQSAPSSPATSASNDAAAAEINKQKAATKAFTDQAATLNQKLASMSDALTQVQQIAQQNLNIQRDLTTLKNRLSTLESQPKAAPATPAPKPATPREDNW